MSVARRPLLTATAAGSLLAALWFVPSANATADQPPTGRDRAVAAAATPRTPSTPGTPSPPRVSTEKRSAAVVALADTGGVDTTPYLVGGAAFLGLGTGMVAFAVRRGARGAL
ncbi:MULTISPECIES: hypothetical protein [Streptomyces]|uniref:LPXTG cell wall anchor domain-containing protein n=1 Tax=Streptomyces lichenis TaxID=2306967 RepID=A0ABT0IHZ1_9ACTN|nr:hypothetical protein [Streptomyces lichenis]MCK8680948.1 hypothetical protein [Streptomyces lichenis]